MFEWSTTVDTQRPLAALPRLLSVCAETQEASSYAHHGRYRRAEPHCILKVTVSGEGRYQDGRGVHTVGAGQGFLCEIADPRTGYWYPEEARAPWRFVYAAFAGTTATAMVRDLVGRLGSVLPVSEGLLRRLRSYHAGATSRRLVSAVEGACFVTDLLWSAAGEAERQQGLTETVPDLVRRARSEAEADPARIASVGELAGKVGVTREHLARVFREQTGQGPREFLEWCRLREACRLLKESSLCTKEVASRLGFGAPSHFTRAFHRRLGMTPRRFREVGSVPLA